MLLEVLIDQFAELTEQCRASAVGRPCGQGRLIEPCDLYQQGDQQGMAGRHVVAFLALRFVLNQLNQWPDGFRAIRNPGKGITTGRCIIASRSLERIRAMDSSGRCAAVITGPSVSAL